MASGSHDSIGGQAEFIKAHIEDLYQEEDLHTALLKALSVAVSLGQLINPILQDASDKQRLEIGEYLDRDVGKIAGMLFNRFQPDHPRLN